MHRTPLMARRALLHPLWLVSLALLVVNDHVLKGAGLVPAAVTGKLSDVVGMIVAPAVLAALLGVTSRRGWASAHVAVAVVFAAINLSPACARAFEQLTALTPLPWAITVDPSDLVVLPFLLVSFVVLGRAMAADERALRTRARNVLQGAALTAGAIACMGTSPPTCDEPECRPQQLPPTEDAALTIGNDTPQQRLIRVRPLKPSIIANCAVLMADPTAALARDMFLPAEAWLLEPGRALPLVPRTQNGCEAFLVDAQGLPMTLVAWNTAEYPVAVLPTATADAANVPGRMIMMRPGATTLELDAHPAVFDAPADEPPHPEPACSVPDETVGIAWSDPPVGPNVIESIASAPDGCHQIELATESFFVCLPLAALPFAAGESLAIHPTSVTGTDDFGAATSFGIELVGETHTIVAVGGRALLPPSLDPEQSWSVSHETQDGCAPHHDACGNLVTPLTVTFLGDGGAARLKAGQSHESPDGSVLHLVRAQSMPIRDTTCDTAASGEDTYFESVLVAPIVIE